ncbi:MAG: hypothetical protein EPN47_10350 [Acidobacteria bacterium]|nr:MAG: hypothetical protein EPN47_10350 [Acidobacteriota bacterium]
MKKLFTLIAAVAIATTLSMPAFAAKKHKKESATTTQTQSKKHTKHAKKKGATEGQKTGQ